MRRIADRVRIFSIAAAAAFASCRAPRAELEIYESWPSETTLDHAELRDAHVVWLERIRAAKTTLDFAEFYASDAPGGRLAPIIEAIEAAAARGVRVRFLAEEKFAKTYPETLDRLAACAGIEVRRYDVAKIFGSGVLHAKYFIIDGREVLVGSQNMDWRSLEHILELGVRTTAPGVARAFTSAFDLDWRIAGGETTRDAAGDGAPGSSLRWEDAAGAFGSARVAPVFSPTHRLAPDSVWDLPELLDWIGAAKRSVYVQVLTYRAKERDGSTLELDGALRAAAARGVDVRLLVADWSKRRGVIEGLQDLARVPGITVKTATIPKASSGDIPFARVIHAKQCVVDGERAWVGTGNWERDYFYSSRNAGLLIDGAEPARELSKFFLDAWDSAYTERVDPDRAYEERPRDAGR